MTPIRLLIVDDHPVARRGVQTLAESALDVSRVSHADTEEAALEAAAELLPELIVLDLRLPGVNPPRLCELLRIRHPKARIVLFTAFEDLTVIRACIAAGAHGCILKDATDVDVGKTLVRIFDGEVVFDPRIADDMAREYAESLRGGKPRLSEREVEVLTLLADGLSNRAIAGRLHLAESTVKGYVATLLEKLGVDSRLQAVVEAQRNGLLT